MSCRAMPGRNAMPRVLERCARRFGAVGARLVAMRGKTARCKLGLIVAMLASMAACSSSSDGNGVVYDAWRAGRSYFEVTAHGAVTRILGTRVGRSGEHEGFLLHLAGSAGHGLTIRIEDNVDLTGPIPVYPGEAVTVRGEYIYDPRGGLIHYTHRDPAGRHAAGYVEVAGRVYQ